MSYSRVPLSEQDADNQEYPPNHRSSGLSSILNSSTTASTTASTTSATTSSSSSATGGHRGITNNGINTNNNTNLLTRVWDNLASPFAASADPPHITARKFITYLQQEYGILSPLTPNLLRSSSSSNSSSSPSSSSSSYTNIPSFECSSYTETLTNGVRQDRSILIYLHSQVHGDTHDFLRYGLCTPEVTQILQDTNMICWAGSVHSSDGYDAAQKFGVTSYPFLGIYDGTLPSSSSSSSSRSSSSSSTTPAVPTYNQRWTHEGGLLKSSELVNILKSVHQASRQITSQIVAEQLARDEERTLQEDQYRDYHQAMQADLEAENERRLQEQQAKEEAAKEEVRKAQEEEEEELKAALEMSMQVDKEAVLFAAQKRLSLNPEPEKGTPETTALRLQLPLGKKLERRFRYSDTLSLVKDFVIVASSKVSQDNEPLLDFDLVQNMPTRTFQTHKDKSTDLGLTLKEAKLIPQAMLFVQTVVLSSSSS